MSNNKNTTIKQNKVKTKMKNKKETTNQPLWITLSTSVDGGCQGEGGDGGRVPICLGRCCHGVGLTALMDTKKCDNIGDRW